MRLYFVIGTHLNIYIEDQNTGKAIVGQPLGKRTIGNRKSHLMTVDKIVGEFKAIDLVKN